MHPVRIGRLVRALRRRLAWRQIDLATRARVSQQAVSLVETGQCRRLSLATLERVLGELEAELELIVRWRGGELDRVVDEAHASLVAAVADLLTKFGWIVQVEVTYAIGRERGSIDLMAFQPSRASILVVEVKVDLTAVDSTLRRHDEKVRLAMGIARDRFGWQGRAVSRLLVLPAASTPRRRVSAHAALFDRAYPLRGVEARRWLRRPERAAAGLLFLSVTNPVGGRRALEARRRIQRSSLGAPTHGSRPAPREHTPGFVDSTGDHQGDW